MIIVFWITATFILSRLIGVSPLGKDFVVSSIEVKNDAGEVTGKVEIPIPVSGPLETIQSLIIYFSLLFQLYYWLSYKFSIV